MFIYLLFFGFMPEGFYVCLFCVLRVFILCFYCVYFVFLLCLFCVYSSSSDATLTMVFVRRKGTGEVSTVVLVVFLARDISQVARLKVYRELFLKAGVLSVSLRETFMMAS
jgi:hypothetical protein